MGYKGKNERKTSSGCLKGCGCFSSGFLCGIIFLPVILYMLMSSSWFKEQLNHLIDTNQISQKLQEVAGDIGNDQSSRISVPIESSGTSHQPLPVSSKKKAANRSLRDKGIRILLDIHCLFYAHSSLYIPSKPLLM